AATIEEAAVPRPGPGQVLIRTEAIGVNYVDVQLRRETSPDSVWFRSLPATLTGDVVGTIEQVGPDTGPALAGTRVAVLLEDAYAVAGTDWLAPVPERLEPGAASRLPTAGAVALGALRAGRLSAGETVLITAGAGAIGHLAVQLAKRQGAGTVIATAGPAKLATGPGRHHRAHRPVPDRQRACRRRDQAPAGQGGPGAPATGRPGRVRPPPPDAVTCC